MSDMSKESEVVNENNENEIHDNPEVVDEEKNQEPEVENIQEKLQAEIASLKDTLIRKVADSENLRKRLEREKNDAVKYANTSLAKDLLPTIDNFEHIIDNMPNKDDMDDNIKAIMDGVVLCQKAMHDALKKHGICRVEAKPGDPFDHQFHQAMCEVPSDDIEPGNIVNIMQHGYIYHDRLIRPTMVSVAKK